MDNIGREEPDKNKEEYESKYTQDDIDLLTEERQEKAATAEIASAKTREQEASTGLEKALAEARLRGQNATVPPTEANTANTAPPQEAAAFRAINEESRAVKTSSADGPSSGVVRKVKTTSDCSNTLSKNIREPRLVQAIIDENIKTVNGSHMRLRLLDDMEISECVIARGAYLYATVSGFSSGRVKDSISSILVNDKLVKMSLPLYDADGMEGLYIPNSRFREASKDVTSGAMPGSMSMSMGSTTGDSLAQWGTQAVSSAYQKTSNAISRAVKKNKIRLRYGAFMYLVDGQEKRNQNDDDMETDLSEYHRGTDGPCYTDYITPNKTGTFIGRLVSTEW